MQMTSDASPRDDLAQPKAFLKWAGGKRSLLPSILHKIGSVEGTYFEPFLGAGSVAIALPSTSRKFLSDTNSELINAFAVVRDSPDELIEELAKHPNNKEHFLEVRSWDRDPRFVTLPPVKRAARFIFLNKTCFNGLYRVNKAGFFNVPFGAQPNARILDAENIRSVSAALAQSAHSGKLVEIEVLDFAQSIRKAGANDLVYADPPYDPSSGTSNFVSYQSTGFSAELQIQLRDHLEAAHARGARVIASNNDTPFIRDIYAKSRGWSLERVAVNRAISASANSRKPAEEVLLSLG